MGVPTEKLANAIRERNELNEYIEELKNQIDKNEFAAVVDRIMDENTRPYMDLEFDAALAAEDDHG